MTGLSPDGGSARTTCASHAFCPRPRSPASRPRPRAAALALDVSATVPGPATIRAARLHAYGEPLVVEPVKLPPPAADEVRVDLEFGGVNPIDRYNAEGRVNPPGPLPRTLGGEAAGVAAGHAVLVTGEALGVARDGVWAEAVNAPRAALVPLPDGVVAREAAAMGIAGLTALNCVRELGRVNAEDRVLVLGASGGVGTMITWMAHHAGATVWGQTGSPDKAAGIAQDGADRVVVCGPEKLGEQIAELAPTVVFDPLGGEFVAPVIEALSPHGRLMSFGTSASPQVSFNMQSLYRKALSVLGYAGGQLPREQRRSGLQAALAALADGSIRVRIDDVLALEAVNQAFTRLTQRRVQGKLLLELS